MALTQPEKQYVERLIAAGADKENIKFYLNKRREEEATLNAPKQQGALGKTLGFFQNIGAGAIQAGGELAVGLPGQLSRLAPGDQSANPKSFYNQTQKLLDYSKGNFEKQGVETQGVGFGIGKGVMNIAGGSVLGGGAAQLANKSKLFANLGLKTTSLLSPQVAPTTMVGKTALFAGKSLAGGTKGAGQGLGVDLASGNAPGAGTLAGGAIGTLSPLAGTVLSRAGKSLYKTAIKPNVDEASKIIQAKAKGFAEPITRADTALKYGITGTETGIGVKGVRKADTIWKKTIQPALEKSKTVHKIDDLFSELKQKISLEKSALRKQELLDGLNALKDDFKTTGKKAFSSIDLQAEKSALDKFTPAKIFKGKDVQQGYTQAKAMLADIMRGKVREDLGKTGLKNAKELYKDYANLADLEKIGIKGLTEGGLRGGTGTMLSTIYDKLVTPVKTIGGKTLYKVGKGVQFYGPKGIKTISAYLNKNGYTVDSNGNINKK